LGIHGLSDNIRYNNFIENMESVFINRVKAPVDARSPLRAFSAFTVGKAHFIRVFNDGGSGFVMQNSFAKFSKQAKPMELS
jgi:hypothetical protein